MKGLKFAWPKYADEKKLENISRVLRGIIFTMLDQAKSGHPGGSSAKVELLLSLLISGHFRYDPLNPKHTGRDRLIWSAGHCSPLLHAINTLIYECYKINKIEIDAEKL